MTTVTVLHRGGRNMGKSVEANRRARTVGTAFRQRWQPRAICVIDPANPGEAVSRIAPRIAESQRACGVSSYLLIDPGTAQAFVLPEDKPVAVEMARLGVRSVYWPWLVGLYAFGRVSADVIADLLEDVCAHLGILFAPGMRWREPKQLDMFSVELFRAQHSRKRIRRPRPPKSFSWGEQLDLTFLIDSAA